VRKKKANDKQSRLTVERKKFAKHDIVSAGVCFGGKGRLHFVEEKAKVDCTYYVGHLLPNLVEDCNRLLSTRFIFQQDGVPAHTAHSAQNGLRANCPDFITKDLVASKFAVSKPNGLSRVGCNVGGLLQA